MTRRDNASQNRKRIELVTVATEAAKVTLGGSGPIQEVDGTGGTKYG